MVVLEAELGSTSTPQKDVVVVVVVVVAVVVVVVVVVTLCGPTIS